MTITRAILSTAGLVLLTACGAGSGDDGENQNNTNENVSQVSCGDGVVEGLEECDDGEANSDTRPDVCRTDCLLPNCGDGVTDAEEECDDGAANSDEVPNACRENCTSPGCGDGVVDVAQGEQCDEGADLPTATCSPNCVVMFCGNGLVEDGEDCDDGNNSAGDGCGPTCLTEECGNFFIDPGEDCDDGNQDPTDGCRADCTIPRCGDGVVDLADGEVCDDGDLVNGDGCSADCRSDESCGNGILDWQNGEQCDDGALNSDTAPDACRETGCQFPSCGDFVTDPSLNEGCDDGDANSIDANAHCRPGCQLATCGDGVLDDQAGEVCDDGNMVSGDGCSSGCLSDETCGNGVVDGVAGEQCDDGNFLSHDGCSSGCTVEALTWVEWKDPFRGRRGHQVVLDEARQRVVLFGGLTNEGASNETWELDGADWQQVHTLHRPPARANFGMAYDFHRQVLVIFGGNGVNGNLADTWEYDGDDWRQVQTDWSPSPRGEINIAYDGARQEIVLFGGRDACTYNGMSDTWIFDGQDWDRRAPATTPSLRIFPALEYDVNRQVVVMMGGYAGPSWQRRDDLWEWNGTTWTSVSHAIRPPARTGHAAMRYHPVRQSILLYGGNEFMDTWELDGAGWTELAPTASPTWTGSVRMAYAPFASGMVLFGGSDGAVYGDETWIFDGSTWTEHFSRRPGNRWDAYFAYDSLRDRVVLFGGRDSSGALNDTWEFDGRRWREIQTAGAPSARHSGSTAFDSDRGVMVILGGYLANNAAVRQVWEYDGVGWTQATSIPSAFMGTTNAGMAYDYSRQALVVFGGWSGNWYNDTWERVGGAWSLKSPALSPPARRKMAVNYDPTLGRVVVFGGDDNGSLSDLWSWDGTIWTEHIGAPIPDARHYTPFAHDAQSQCLLLYGGTANGGGAPTDTWALCSGNWSELQPSENPGARNRHLLVGQPTRQQTVLFGGAGYDEGDTWLLRYVSPWPEEDCQSGADEDGDGLVDCMDPDCQLRPCEDCRSGTDVDGDGLVDCVDPDCALKPCGVGQGLCSGGVCQDLFCGDGAVDTSLNEECDDGNAVGGDGCEPNCIFSCLSGSGALAVRVDPVSGRCMGVFDSALPWVDAESACVAWGGHLATLTNDSESRLAAGLATRVTCDYVWMGLNDRAVEGTYEWTSGEPFSYASWHSGQPNDSGASQNCCLVHAGAKTFFDTSCAPPQPYLCEVPGS